LLRRLYRAISRRSYDNFARSNQSLALRFLFAGAKSFAPVNVCMSAPYRLVISRQRPNSCRWDPGHLMAQGPHF
jgi:hypothetical protein